MISLLPLTTCDCCMPKIWWCVHQLYFRTRGLLWPVTLGKNTQISFSTLVFLLLLVHQILVCASRLNLASLFSFLESDSTVHGNWTWHLYSHSSRVTPPAMGTELGIFILIPREWLHRPWELNLASLFSFLESDSTVHGNWTWHLYSHSSRVTPPSMGTELGIFILIPREWLHRPWDLNLASLFSFLESDSTVHGKWYRIYSIVSF